MRAGFGGGLPAKVMAVALVCSAAIGGAPLPPPRPADLGAERPAEVPSGPPAPDPSPPSTAGCLGELRKAGTSAEPVPAPGVPDPACTIEEPVRLSAIADPSGRPGAIALPDRPIVACRLAVAFSAWAGRVAAPILADSRKSELRAILTGPGFECRPRNRQAGAKLSAHALGLAIDVAGFRFADGPALSVGTAAKGGDEAAFAAVRASACGWFLTVLGPGSDLFHANHLHLDVQQHGSSNRYRICQ